MKANLTISPGVRDGYNSHPRYYFNSERLPYCIGATPKAGSTSINHTCKRAGLRLIARPRQPVVLVLRHPLDRLTSAYEFFVHQHNVYPGGNGQRPGWDCAFDEFVNHTERDHNMHWVAQTFQHPDWREYKLLPLEELSTWWNAMLPEFPMDHRKKSKRKPWREYYSDEQFARQTKRYAEDIEAYERAVDSGIHTV